MAEEDVVKEGGQGRKVTERRREHIVLRYIFLCVRSGRWEEGF